MAVVHAALEQRPGPVGARSTVLRRGDRELDVDIPPVGCRDGEWVPEDERKGFDASACFQDRRRFSYVLPSVGSVSCLCAAAAFSLRSSWH